MRAKILVATAFLFSTGLCLGECPSADLTGDSSVDYEDFALVSNQWLTGDPCDPCVPEDIVYVPGGTFEMGDNLGDGPSHERQVHTVTVDSFYIGKYEVTNHQYCDYLNDACSSGQIRVAGGTVYATSDDSNDFPYCDIYPYSSGSQIDYNDGVFSVRTKNERDMSNDPMVCVSWYGSAAYCNWRSHQEGKEQCYNLSTWNCDFDKPAYRLTTEAEWEYAARGGLSGRRFPWGDTISHSQANYYSYWKDGHPYYFYDLSPTEGYHPNWDDGIQPYTSPVGSFAANDYGLYDIGGNAWEWCNDWYDEYYYYFTTPNNPIGPITGSRRVLRGGDWQNRPYRSRVANRGSDTPSYRYGNGFRLVLDLEARCPSADVTGDCFVDFNDFVIMAAEWPTEGVPTDPCDMVWVDINDPGVSGHEGFVGQMSKYETTNAQYCQFLNAALASGDIYVDSNRVYGSNGSNDGADFVDEIYFPTFPEDDYSQITYSGGVFSVRSRDGYDMSNHPAVKVSWYGAMAFCSYYGYRLPTEWEWRAVADYDGSYNYGCGTTLYRSWANYNSDVSGFANPLNLSSQPYTSPVDYYCSYGYGMNDMAGNVWEWTDSCHYGDCGVRVLRGGSWYDPGSKCKVGAWDFLSLHTTASFAGFRVCR